MREPTPRRWSLASVVGLGAATLVLVSLAAGEARAALFGTSVNFNNTVFASPLDAFSSLTFSSPLSEDTMILDMNGGFARARASATPQALELGVFAGVTGSPHQARAGAVVFTDMTVVGDTPPRLNGSFRLEGSFEGSPAQVNLRIWDLNETLLAELVANSQAAGTVWSGWYDPTPEDRTDPNPPCFNCPGPSLPPPIPWPGSFNLPFVVPLGSDNGILVELWAGAFLSDGPNEANFLDTAALSFTPPPGVEVILATGQRFVPEPASPALLATGLAVWAAARWRPRGR